tara:strand:- start:1909 stop:2328 length:420 start_codon:yes stop_codon:yes gene_type:complete
MSNIRSKEILEYCDSILIFTMRDRLTELRHTNRDEYVSKCNTKYEDFFTKYPTLFYKIIDDPISFKNHGRKRLLKMLNIKADVDSNKTSHEEASKKIGRSYYNEYVKPVINTDDQHTSGKVKNEISQLINSLSDIDLKK